MLVFVALHVYFASRTAVFIRDDQASGEPPSGGDSPAAAMISRPQRSQD
jgi:hypothetical protein